MENLISIPGRLHSVAIEEHVAGANEIYDDELEKLQDEINSYLVTNSITNVQYTNNLLRFYNSKGIIVKVIPLTLNLQQSDYAESDSNKVTFIKNKPTIPTKTSDLTNDSGFITDISGKQDVIEDLDDIRSGAAAGATAYQKPSTGIPTTDLTSAAQVSLGKADTALQEHQSLAGLVNTGSYNTVSKKIELKHDNTVLAEIDATAFIKDGMVSSVTISNGYLVITFNTDAGKEPISIALIDIFNPANYYTKTQADVKFASLAGDNEFTGDNYFATGLTIGINGTVANLDGFEVPWMDGNTLMGKTTLILNGVNETLNISTSNIVLERDGHPEDTINLRAIKNTIDGLATVATSGSYNDLSNTPTIPTTLSDLSSDSTHRTVTDAEKQTWNNKSDFSGSYNDLRNKPTIQEIATVKHLYALDSTNSDYPSMIGPYYVYLNKTCTFGTISIVNHTPEGVEDGFTNISAQTYSEAEATIDNTTYTSYSYNNKYYLGIKSPFFTADVAHYGHDKTMGVIKFVATQEGLFKVHSMELPLGRCVIKVNGVDTTSLDQNIVAVQVNVGDVVKIIPTFTSSKYVRIIGFVLEGNCGVSVFVNDAGYLTEHQDISGKADKVSNATNGNFAALDSNGNLTDSGHKHSDYLTSHQDLSNYVQKSNIQGLLKNDGTVDTTQYLSQHQDISGKADKSEMSIVPGTNANADKTTITLKQGTSATVLTAHQDISGKANTIDLATVATSGSYNDLDDKPTIPTVPTNVSAFTNDSGYLTASDITSKLDIIPIEAVASGTTAINAVVNTYYEVAGEVGALAIILPTPTDLTKVSMVVVHLTAGTNPNVVIGSTAVIDYSAAYDISASKEYEINCLFNGGKWVVADMEVV